MTIAARDANGAIVQLASVPVGTATALAHVMTDGTGTPYSAGNPLLTAPAIEATSPLDRGGAVASSGGMALTVAANPSRKGGWIQANPKNAGNILVSIVGQASQAVLAPGASFSMTVNGYVYQGQIVVSGDTAGDSFAGVEFV